MQLGGVGSEHTASMHQITTCSHDHSHVNKESGGGAMAAKAAERLQQAETQQEAQFSLSAWLDRTLGNGKRMLKNFWGSGDGAGLTQAGDKAEGSQVMAQIYSNHSADDAGRDTAYQGSPRQDDSQTLHTPQIAAAATAVNPQTSQQGPYFAAVEDTGMQEESIWQKVRVKFKDITGQLTGHLSGKLFQFQTKNSFQAKQERPKEELRKRDKLRRDEVKLDCFKTDDSYLLDSYDRKGEYSKLSAKK